jgi:hypothetical protein
MSDDAKRGERYAQDPEYRRQRKRDQKNAWARANRDKINARQRARYAADPEYRKSKGERNRRGSRQRNCRTYGLTVQDFDAILVRQEGACGICRRPFRGTPHIDHCHLTGWVRGLLCRGCNPGLGSFDNNPAFMVDAAIYMQSWVEYLIDCFREEESAMTSNTDVSANLIRDAVLKELQQPFGVTPSPPTDRLQAVARALVDKAEDRDVAAIKEVFDRAAGRPNAHGRGPIPSVLNVSWQNPLIKPKLAAKVSTKPSPAVRGRARSVAKDQARRRAVG